MCAGSFFPLFFFFFLSWGRNTVKEIITQQSELRLWNSWTPKKPRPRPALNVYAVLLRREHSRGNLRLWAPGFPSEALGLLLDLAATTSQRCSHLDSCLRTVRLSERNLGKAHRLLCWSEHPTKVSIFSFSFVLSVYERAFQYISFLWQVSIGPEKWLSSFILRRE